MVQVKLNLIAHTDLTLMQSGNRRYQVQLCTALLAFNHFDAIKKVNGISLAHGPFHGLCQDQASICSNDCDVGVLEPDQVAMHPLASVDDDSDTEEDRSDRTAEASTSSSRQQPSANTALPKSKLRSSRTRGPIVR